MIKPFAKWESNLENKSGIENLCPFLGNTVDWAVCRVHFIVVNFQAALCRIVIMYKKHNVERETKIWGKKYLKNIYKYIFIVRSTSRRPPSPRWTSSPPSSPASSSSPSSASLSWRPASTTSTTSSRGARASPSLPIRRPCPACPCPSCGPSCSSWCSSCSGWTRSLPSWRPYSPSSTMPSPNVLRDEFEA